MKNDYDMSAQNIPVRVNLQIKESCGGTSRSAPHESFLNEAGILYMKLSILEMEILKLIW